MRLYASTPLRLYTSTPLRLYASTPLRLFTSTPLHLYASTPLHLYVSTPLRLYTSTPLRFYASTPLCLYGYAPRPSPHGAVTGKRHKRDRAARKREVHKHLINSSAVLHSLVVVPLLAGDANRQKTPKAPPTAP